MDRRSRASHLVPLRGDQHMTQAKIDVPTKKAARLTRKSKADKRQKKNSPPPSLLTDHERVDLLLDEALRGTFPASDAAYCRQLVKEFSMGMPRSQTNESLSTSVA